MAERPLPAYEGDEPYVFVSYSHDDETDVYTEIRWLQDGGIHVWYDTGISVGSEWSEALARAIKGASHFIYFVTPRSVASENCRRELNFALEEQGSILAVHLEPTDVPDGIRLNLNNRQALFRYTDSNYRQNLFEVLSVKRSNDSIESTRHLAPRVSITRRPLAVTFAIATLLCVAGVITWYFLPSFDAGGDSPEQIRSLAVLPLENLSGDADQDYVADGMTAALIDELGRLGSLKVISRLSVMRYKHSEKSLPEIASELGVRALVGGTVLKEGGKFRVTVELIDAETDTQIWNDRFDSELSGVLALHADVARAVAEQIRLELTPREEILLAASRPVDPEAYEAYQKGLYLQNYVERGGDPYRESLLRSIEYQKEAIKRDPGWALAYASLARTYHFLGGGDENGAKFFALSKAASLKALELDDSLAKAHESLAYVLANYEWDWEGAAREYQRALDLDPNSVDYWGYSILLWAVGPDEAAIAGFERAEEQSPDSLSVKTQFGMVYTCASQHDKAVEQLQKVLELNPEYAEAYIALGRAHMAQSMYEEAVAEMEKAIELCDETTCVNTLLSPWPALGEAYARAGRTAEALEILRELEATERAYFPGLYAALGRNDKALAHLEAGAEKRLSHTIFLRCSWFDSLRDEPRFQDLVRRMNFP